MDPRRCDIRATTAVTLLIQLAGALASPARAESVGTQAGPCPELSSTLVREARVVPRTESKPFVVEYSPERAGLLVVTLVRRGTDAQVSVSSGASQVVELISPAATDGQDSFLVDGKAGEPIRLSILPSQAGGAGASLQVRISRWDGGRSEPSPRIAALRQLTSAYGLYRDQTRIENDAAAAILEAMAQGQPAPVKPSASANWKAVEVSLAKAGESLRACGPVPPPEVRMVTAEVAMARAALATLKLESWETALTMAREAEVLAAGLGLVDAAIRAKLYQASALIDGAAEAKRSNDAQRRGEVSQSFDAAVALLTAARAHYRRNGRVADEAYVENYLGAANHYTGNWPAARQHYEAAIRLYARTPLSFRHAVVLQNLALLASESGDYPEAARLFDEAKALISRHPQPDMLATILENQGATLSTLGRQDDAIEAYSAAMSIRRVQGNQPAIARSTLGIGVALMRAGDLRGAEPFVEQAWTMRTSLRQRDPRGWFGSGLARAEMLRLHDDHANATSTLDTIAEVATSPAQKARLAIQRGKVLLEQGRHAHALVQYDSVLALGLPPINPNVMLSRVGRLRALVELGEIDGARQALAEQREPSNIFPGSLHALDAKFLEAGLEARIGARDLALARIEDAIVATRAIRATSLSAEARARFAASRREQEELKICLLTHCSAFRSGSEVHAVSGKDAIESLLAGESARAEAFAELLSGAPERRDRGSRTEAERAALLSEIDSKLARLDVLTDRPIANAREMEALRQSVLNAQMRLRRLEPSPTLSPRERAAKQREARTQLEALISQVPEGTRVLEFFLGRRSAFVWVVGRGEVSVHEIASDREDIASLRREARGLLTASPNDPKLSQLLQRLGRRLIAPYIDLPTTRRLIVIPDGELFFVPFAALRVVQPDGSNTDGVALVDAVETVLAPSLSQLTFSAPARDFENTSATRVAVIADPVFDGSDPRVPRNATHRVMHAAGADGLERLPASADESRALRDLLPHARVSVLSGNSATRSGVIEALGPGVSIAHFATHGVVRASTANLSFLALSAYDGTWAPIPSRLYSTDILSAGMRADLVVLSACRSAIGEVIGGEGPMGLSYSFLANGSRTVVAATWPVPDRFAAEFMKDFYTALVTRKLSPASALRAAQSNARRSLLWNSPYYWAAFAVTTYHPLG